MCLKLAGALDSAVKRLRYAIGQERYAEELPRNAAELPHSAMGYREMPRSRRAMPQSCRATPWTAVQRPSLRDALSPELNPSPFESETCGGKPQTGTTNYS